MIQLTRIAGMVLIAVGAISIATWLIKPLRQVWPWIMGPARQWFLGLPMPIQVGTVAATFGFVLLTSSLIWERFEDYKREKGLFDE